MTNDKFQNYTNLSKTNDSPQTYILQDTFVTISVVLFCAYIIAKIIALSLILLQDDDRKYGNYIYYIGLIVYQILVLSISLCAYANISSLPETKISTSWYEIIFYVKFVLCSLFNLITGILMVLSFAANNIDDSDDGLWCLVTITYFLDIISIPLPGIVLFKYLRTKKSILGKTTYTRTQSHVRWKQTMSNKSPLLEHDVLDNRRNRSHDSKSVSAQLDVRKNVFNDKKILPAICCVYLIHLVSYIIIPARNENEFGIKLDNIYPQQKNHFFIVMYVINHGILRTFKGMVLSGLFFAFFTTIIASDQEIYSHDTNKLSDAAAVILLLKKNWCFFICALILGVLSIIPAAYDIYINDTEPDIFGYMPIIMIFINGIGALIVIWYMYLFTGAINKYTTPDKDTLLNGAGRNIDNKTYSFKAILLLILFVTQLITLLKSTSNGQDDYFLWLQMLSVFVFCALQFITLIQLRTLQSNDAYIRWSKKYNRKRNMIWFYFRFLTLINVADLIFVYVYPQQYYKAINLYSDDDNDDAKIRVSYAVSFASGAVFIISISQLTISYAEFYCHSCLRKESISVKKKTSITELSNTKAKKSINSTSRDFVSAKVKSGKV
eukprot:451812_1